MKNNVLSIDFTEEQYNDVLKKFDEIEIILFFLIVLSEEDRHGGFRLGTKNLGFLERYQHQAKVFPGFYPFYVDANEVTKDVNATQKLNAIKNRAAALLQKIDDTLTQTGFEALSAALVYYNNVKLAASKDIPNAKSIYDALSTYFPGRKPDNKEVKE